MTTNPITLATPATLGTPGPQYIYFNTAEYSKSTTDHMYSHPRYLVPHYPVNASKSSDLPSPRNLSPRTEYSLSLSSPSVSLGREPSSLLYGLHPPSSLSPRPFPISLLSSPLSPFLSPANSFSIQSSVFLSFFLSSLHQLLVPEMETMPRNTRLCHRLPLNCGSFK